LKEIAQNVEREYLRKALEKSEGNVAALRG